MSTTPEGRIKQQVVSVLKKHKVWYFFPASNGYGKSGIPDIIACVSGRFLGIECKSDASKTPTALQVKCGADIRTSGGVWMVVCDDESIQQLEHTLASLHRLGV